ncbi:hypothetical protein [Nonomuraea sp. NPDC003709]|uniref:hypothetical protein n=1 Tax=Nonomuraea sp. NPDC003709 TaxID=3154450 RepID=UPI0033B7572C
MFALTDGTASGRRAGAVAGLWRPGDTVHISEMFRLVRGTGHILDVLDVLHRDQVALRIHDGAFLRYGPHRPSPAHRGVAVHAAGELQRELTYDGLRAAEAKGSKGRRRPAVAAEKTDDVRTAYLEGRSIAALARDHGVSRTDTHSPPTAAPFWVFRHAFRAPGIAET